MAKKKYRKGRGFIDQLSHEDALSVLKELSRQDKKIAQKIKQIATQYLTGVDIDEIATNVYALLDNLEIEDVYYGAGRTKDGYVEPGEFAWQMMEDSLEFHRKAMIKYQKISMEIEALNYCMGIILGIYNFDYESKNEVKRWAEDAPGELFYDILEEWKKLNAEDKYEQKILAFIKKRCSKYKSDFL